MMQNPLQNPFMDWLDTNPEVGYYAFGRQGGQSANQKNFFRNQFSNVHNQFLGQLGQQILGGQLPDLRFGDFLKSYDFGGAYNRATPRERGQGFGYSSQFAPQARWNF